MAGDNGNTFFSSMFLTSLEIYLTDCNFVKQYTLILSRTLYSRSEYSVTLCAGKFLLTRERSFHSASRTPRKIVDKIVRKVTDFDVQQL